MRISQKLMLCSLLGSLLLIPGCGENKYQGKKNYKPRTKEQRETDKVGYLFEEPLFTTKKKTTGGERYGVGANVYLWRAALDALSFLPKKNTDPFGGTIFTEWYVDDLTPDERIKVDVYILGRELRSDAIKVSLFKQKRTKDGSWVHTVIQDETKNKLEEAILTRARELRLEDEKIIK